MEQLKVEEKIERHYSAQSSTTHRAAIDQIMEVLSEDSDSGISDSKQGPQNIDEEHRVI